MEKEELKQIYKTKRQDIKMTNEYILNMMKTKYGDVKITPEGKRRACAEGGLHCLQTEDCWCAEGKLYDPQKEDCYIFHFDEYSHLFTHCKDCKHAKDCDTKGRINDDEFWCRKGERK